MLKLQDKLDKLIVALDVDKLEEAERIVDKLKGTVQYYKIGSQLFTAYGADAVKRVGEKGVKVFLDLKFYDIPQTVFYAVSSGTGITCTYNPTPNSTTSFPTTSYGIENQVKNSIYAPVFMMTVHASADSKVLEEAVRGASEKAKELSMPKPLIIGVTVLTSDDLGSDTERVVLERAEKSKKAGLDGVVCSALEARAVKNACGSEFKVVIPGIRAQNAPSDDQRRKATAAEAFKAGADFIVVGRPILKAADPLKAAKELLA